MALNDYAGLKQSIIDHLERSDLADQVDDFIDLAEAEHVDDLRFREIEEHKTDFAIAANDRYLDISTLSPAFADLKLLRVQNPSTIGSGRRYLPKVEELVLTQLSERSVNHVSPPRWFAVHDDFIELHAPADVAYTAELFYWKKVTPLDDTNTSNEILVRAPGAYLYGALKATAPFLVHDERLATWEGLYDQVVAKVSAGSRKSKRTGRLTARTRQAMR